ncbi:hypothetical protein LXA43DRAFT_971383 [Ganoderma leucocontextum]|nr:hypothetical protein LXA43DRAFT_971383 [Ganoderma leucocontextum]
MILLDGIDKHDDEQHPPKLVAEASSSSVPVARAHTPTPSLPDYEASQAQLRPTTQSYSDIQTKRTRRRRCRKYTIYVLAAYFVLTVVIGVPVIVMKTKRKPVLTSSPYQPWADNDPLPPKTVQLGDAPLRISAAKSCNAWNVKDRPDGAMYMSQLKYHIPVNGSVFLDTNITYATNTSYLDRFAGSLLVTVNDDVSVPDGVVHVTMHHTSIHLGHATNVCLMETGTGGGLYVFAPKNLSTSDGLIFNITLLLPQNNTSPRNIPSLTCHLPHFQHTYQQLDPQVTFNNVVFGGAMSGVYVESLQAQSATVKTSSAEIRGKFKVSTQLDMETVSAPINAQIDLYNDGAGPTFMHLTTGNSVINVNVTLHAPQTTNSSYDGQDGPLPPPPGAQFYTYAETFNAPLNVAVAHAADSPKANFRLRAVNNLGNTHVALDSKYEGTFDVNTMFAQADVLTWDGTQFDDNYDDDSDDDDDGGSNPTLSTSSSSSTPTSSNDPDLTEDAKVRMFLPSLPTTTSTGDDSTSSAAAQPSGRCLEYDLISPSEIRGWVGVPPRPSQRFFHGRPYDNQSHVDVVSSLSGAQLVLQP